MKLIEPALTGDNTPTEQLFRYAKDLDTLMQQHHRLQEHHQMLLQSLGQEVQGDDLLPNALTRVAPLHWASDVYGRIVRSAAQNFSEEAHLPTVQIGRKLEQMVAAEDLPRLKNLLARFSHHGIHTSAVVLRLHFLPAQTTHPVVALDLLVMPFKRNGNLEIQWIAQRAQDDDFKPLHALSSWVQGVKSDTGLVLVEPHGNMLAVSDAYALIAGYTATELVGNDTYLLNSGRHDANFFRDFWYELLDAGHWSGSLFNRRKEGQIFLAWLNVRMVEDEAGQVLSYVGAMVDQSYAEPSVKRLEAIANTDPLTGLPNRRMLMAQLGASLAEAEESQDTLALLFIDLDCFKPINDELGHAIGDLVLREVALRMRRALHPDDLLARVGGDEFVVLLRGNQRVAMAESIGAHIQAALVPEMEIQNCRLNLQASIGCARYPLDARDVATLMQLADAAMYGAKRFGIPFCFYDVGLEEDAQPNLELDLWQAFQRHEMSLLYQPQIDSTGAPKMRGCEALMRWHHPELGEVDPALFIALAECSGAILPLGNWALNQACEQLRRWRDQGLPEFTLSLNLSLRQLRNPLFLGEVCRALDANGLPPHVLELELSETQALLFASSDADHIRALRELGVRIAIDDYGISFASLSRLNFLAISSFKINSQCVRDLTTSEDARAISNCMIAVSQAMGIEVIAQGVETQAQARVLAQQGCQTIQGYFSAHPLSAAGLADFVRAL